MYFTIWLNIFALIYINELPIFPVGYETVAINQNIDENIFESEKKKKKKGSASEPVVCNLPAPLEIEDLIDEFKGKLKILTRITFSFSDPVRTHSLVIFFLGYGNIVFYMRTELKFEWIINKSINSLFQSQSSLLQKYNIFAVLPKNKNAFLVSQTLLK